MTISVEADIHRPKRINNQYRRLITENFSGQRAKDSALAFVGSSALSDEVTPKTMKPLPAQEIIAPVVLPKTTTGEPGGAFMIADAFEKAVKNKKQGANAGNIAGITARAVKKDAKKAKIEANRTILIAFQDALTAQTPQERENARKILRSASKIYETINKKGNGFARAVSENISQTIENSSPQIKKNIFSNKILTGIAMGVLAVGITLLYFIEHKKN